ncbi:MAG: M48 family metallopeptidase [Burkholderiales bacterium]
MRATAVAASAVLAASALMGCATKSTTAGRGWNLDQCADSPSATVDLKRPDGALAASVPRESCVALRSAAQKIQAQADFRLTRLYVADVKAPNAFATRDKSGNPVAAVTLGMLTAIGPDEAAWAGLLGHEIGHHVRRHSEGRKSAATSASVTGNVLANVISYSIPGIGGLIGGTLAGTAAQNAMYGAYTRPQEAEADEVGLKWMVAAGYDPQGMLRLFKALSAGGASSMPAFLSTHPANEERARRVEAFIASSGTGFAAPSE